LTERDLAELLEASSAKEYKIYTQRMGPFRLHYNIWGKS